MKNPKAQAWLFFIGSSVLLALVLFLSAGTLNYWQAWAYLCVGTISNIPLTRYLSNDPVLLERRLKAGPWAEQRPIQKIIVLCLLLTTMAAFILPALDRRFGWSGISPWLSLAGDVLILLSMWMAYRVFQENAFASATVEIRRGQKVVSTGPYAIVRNPMYASAALYFIGLSLALGSYWGLVPAVLSILCMVVRLFDEEKFLARNLPGYTEYCAKVRSHLIPGLF